MIQALRNMITLFTHFFDSLEYMLDKVPGPADLMHLPGERHEAGARIGSNRLQQLINCKT